MRKRPGMSLLIIAALTLGIGVNSAVFSVISSVLLHPVQFSDPDRIVIVFGKSQLTSSRPFSYPDFLDLKEQSRTLRNFGAYQPFLFNLKSEEGVEALAGIRATASLFDAFGVRPAIGRGFAHSDEHPNAAPAAVISHGLWVRHFGGDPSVLGKTIVLHNQPYAIVGVLPPIEFPMIQDVWVDIGPFVDQQIMNRENRFFYVFAQVAPSATLDQAQNEMETIATRLAANYPKSNKDSGILLKRLVDQLTATARKPILLIAIASGLVLLLACVNVMTVFVASTIERRRELSVRLALGAERSVVFRQVVVHSFIFAVIGAALGLLLAKAGLIYLIAKFPYAVYHFKTTTLDPMVFWFTLGLALSCTLLAGLPPGLYIAKLNINSELKGESMWAPYSRYRALGQGALIVVEVALAAGLALTSGLLIKSFWEVERVDLGYDPQHVFAFQVSLPAANYKDEAARVSFSRQAAENLRAIPGVQSATGSYTVPEATGNYIINLQADAQSALGAERPYVDANSIMPGFFSSMKIQILQGRDFTETDSADSPPVAIVDETAAARLWPGQSVLGKRLRLADISDNGPPWREVIGVVRQIKYFGPERKMERMQVYQPLYQHPPQYMCFVINTTLSEAVIRAATEKAIHATAPDLAIIYFQSLQDRSKQRVSGREISWLLLVSFAIIGLSLGMVGIYGVVSNSVVRRRREIAIRMALGASIRNAVLLVIKGELLAALTGMALGAIIVVCLTSVLSSFLFGVKTLDPQVFLLSAVAIVVLVSIASLVPAANLLRFTPQEILREQ